MQNSTDDADNDVLNSIPEHPPSSSLAHHSDPKSKSNAAPSAPERPQNFSFSSAYTASRFAHKFSSVLPTARLGFDFKPISAFAVLNHDNLATATAVGVGVKPNAIVRPFRRPELPLPGPLHTDEDSSDSPASQAQPLSHQQQQQAAGLGSSVALPVRNFAEELNRKLRSLHHRENHGAWTKSRTSSRNGSTQESLNKRPLFITTVPTGVFLPPAREAPLPSQFRRRIYAYSSHPVVFDSYKYSSNNYYTNNNNNNNKQSATFPKGTTRGSAAPIVAADKDYEGETRATVSDTHLNGSRARGIDRDGGGAEEAKAKSKALAFSPLGSVQITKQQFRQQIQHRAKREAPVEPYRNVMHDRRVVRGSNFGATNLLADADPFDKAAELRRRQALRKKTQSRNQRNILGTPPPVKGRRHEVIQTEKYLEQLVERPPEFSVDTQTDLFLERPPTPPYIPAKVGVDVGTEIAEGELFHFDSEAQPIIEILVDACIEQSMLEVAHEQEIQALRRKQEEFLAQREAELAELRRLEAEEIRLQAEKERRLRQDAIAKELDEEMQKGVTAAKLLQGHIAGLLPEVLENLEPATDAAKKEKLMKTICPWLSVEVAEEVGQIVDSREILTVIIQEIIKQRATVYAGYKEEEEVEPAPPTADGEEEGGAEHEAECCECETEESEGCPPVV